MNMVGTYYLYLNTRTYLLGTFTVPKTYENTNKNQGLQKKGKKNPK